MLLCITSGLQSDLFSNLFEHLSFLLSPAQFPAPYVLNEQPTLLTLLARTTWNESGDLLPVLVRVVFNLQAFLDAVAEDTPGQQHGFVFAPLNRNGVGHLRISAVRL